MRRRPLRSDSKCQKNVGVVLLSETEVLVEPSELPASLAGFEVRPSRRSVPQSPRSDRHARPRIIPRDEMHAEVRCRNRLSRRRQLNRGAGETEIEKNQDK